MHCDRTPFHTFHSGRVLHVCVLLSHASSDYFLSDILLCNPPKYILYHFTVT